MKKRFSIIALLVSVLLTATATFQATYIFCVRRQLIGMDTTVGYDAEKLAYIDDLYRNYYVGELDKEKITDAVIRGYISGSGEYFGGYMTTEEYAARMEDVQGELVGIGVSVVYNEDAELIQVVSVMDDSPAKAAGILPGDMFSAVNGEDAHTLGYDGVMQAMLGKEGTTVSVSMLRSSPEGETLHEFTVTRQRIKEQSVFYGMCTDGKTGLIRITGFNAGTAEQFEKAMSNLKDMGMEAVVFDLRNNPGGTLDSVSKVLDSILPEGDIILTTDKNGKKTVMAKSDEKELQMPMAVLINGGSASAAELFAGCIRDYNKGPLVGEKTYGKGSMQTFFTLPDGSAVSITYQKFTPPSGISHDGVGIPPDIEVSLPEEYENTSIFLLTEEQDTVLGEAIKYLNGENADN